MQLTFVRHFYNSIKWITFIRIFFEVREVNLNNLAALTV